MHARVLESHLCWKSLGRRWQQMQNQQNPGRRNNTQYLALPTLHTSLASRMMTITRVRILPPCNLVMPAHLYKNRSLVCRQCLSYSHDETSIVEMIDCLHFVENFLPTGTIFWKWSLSPRNPRDDYLQISADDSTFIDIISPSAKEAIQITTAMSPLGGCQKARPASLT